MKAEITPVVHRLLDRVQLPRAAMTVIDSSSKGHPELLVWIDSHYRHALKTMPKRIGGVLIHAEIRPAITPRDTFDL